MHQVYYSLSKARQVVYDDGGWLLDLGNGGYLVTDDAGTVADLRGQDWLDLCEDSLQWDETKLF